MPSELAWLMNATIGLTRSYQDLLHVFRQMVFNIVAHNRDDHAKNFAFVMNDLGEWSLSPAYDLIFAAGPGGEHTMTIMGKGRAPTRDHVLQLAKQFDIKPKDAMKIIARVNAGVAKWPRFAGEAGCTKKTTRSIASMIRPL